MDLLHDVHAGRDTPEDGKTLTVLVTLAAKVQLELIADHDRKRRCGSVRTAARHRERAIDVPQPGHARSFERDWREHLPPPRRVALKLNDLDLHVMSHRVVRPHRP